MNMGQAQHTFAIDVNGKTYATDLIDPSATVTLLVRHSTPGPTRRSARWPAIRLGDDGDRDRRRRRLAGGRLDIVLERDERAGDGRHARGRSRAFLTGDQTSTQGNQPLKPTMDGTSKSSPCAATQVEWEVSTGQFVDAMAFNGQIPGPQIQVSYGDHVRIILQNQLDQPTVLHFHGMTVPNEMDGVPYITQDPIMPGSLGPYEFTVQDPPGMYVYHSHFNSTEQVGAGLYGAIIVEPKTRAWPYPVVRRRPSYGSIAYTARPAGRRRVHAVPRRRPARLRAERQVVPGHASRSSRRTGDWVLIHMANDGSMLHPMHLHGYHFEVVAQDGFPLQEPYMADTLVVAPGQRFDVLLHAVLPRRVGVPLPHPAARRGAAGHVRDGDGADRAVTRRGQAQAGRSRAPSCPRRRRSVDRQVAAERRRPASREVRQTHPGGGASGSKPAPSSSISRIGDPALAATERDAAGGGLRVPARRSTGPRA